MVWLAKNIFGFKGVAKNHKNYKQHNELKLCNNRYNTLYNDNMASDRPLLPIQNFLLTNVYKYDGGNCSNLWLAIYIFILLSLFWIVYIA